MRKSIDPALLPKTLRRFADKIEDISDERTSGDGYWVYLKPGWISPEDTHQLHEDTITECARAFGLVLPCECADCKKDGSAPCQHS